MTEGKNRFQNIFRKYNLLCVMLTGAFFYLLHIFLYPFPKRDALTYLHILQQWIETGSHAGILRDFPKFGLLLFQFLPVKWAAACGADLYCASLVLMFVMTMVSLRVLYVIVLELSQDHERAFFAGLLFSVHPMILLYSSSLMRDTPYLMWSLLSIWFFIRCIRTGKALWQLLLGLGIGMALLSRYEAWELLVIFPAAALFFAIRKKYAPGQIFRWILFSAAGFSATFSVMFLLVGDTQELLLLMGKTLFSYLPNGITGG